MNRNQTDFLDKLDALFREFNIEKVQAGGDPIVFLSNGQGLTFTKYDNGSFDTVAAVVEEYRPYAEPRTMSSQLETVGAHLDTLEHDVSGLIDE